MLKLTKTYQKAYSAKCSRDHRVACVMYADILIKETRMYNFVKIRTLYVPVNSVASFGSSLPIFGYKGHIG